MTQFEMNDIDETDSIKYVYFDDIRLENTPRKKTKVLSKKMGHSQKYQDLILKQIQESERKYYQDISLFIEIYEYPSKMMGAMDSIEEHRILFGNIINLQALSERTIKFFDNFGIVEGFFRLSKSLSSFLHYAQNYLDARKTYLELYEHNHKFRSFIDFQERDSPKSFHNFSYFHYLPIERIFRYKTLFTCLRLHTLDKDSYEMLKEILTTLGRIIYTIEKYLKYCDSFEKMCKIQKQISNSCNFSLIMPGRKLLYDAKMQKYGIFRFYQKIILCNDVLIILIKKFKKFTVKKSWVLSECVFVYEFNGDKNCYFENGNHICGSSAILKVYHPKATSTIKFGCMFDAYEIFSIIRSYGLTFK